MYVFPESIKKEQYGGDVRGYDVVNRSENLFVKVGTLYQSLLLFCAGNIAEAKNLVKLKN